MKKILRIPLLLVALLLTSIPLSAHYFEVDGIYYNITSSTDKTVEVSYRGSYSHYYSNEYTGSVVIPEAVTYSGTTYSVTSIGSSAFSGCTGLTEVTIPNSITSIGSSAFSGCEKLASITIPNSVIKIGRNAFYNCNNLEIVNISDLSAWCRIDFDPIGPDESGIIDGPLANGQCKLIVNGIEITDLVIPKDITEIRPLVFFGYKGLKSLTIPNSVTSIGSSAFSGCTGLTEVTIPNSITSIGSSAFSGCTGLTEVTIPNSVTSIGNYAFRGCSGLTSITIPNSVTSIGENAFSGCTGLTTVNFNATNCTTMGRYSGPVFSDCTAFTTLNIGDNVTNIPSSAFRGCSGLTSITIPNSVTSIGENAFWGCSGLISVTIPNSVTTIGDFAFYGCSGLISVTIPNSVTTIGDFAFYGCTGLTSVTIGNSVTSIGKSAFYNCPGLTSVTIPNSVTTIGDYAFSGCTGLTSVTIPESIITIGKSAFSGCNRLTTVNFNATNCTSMGSSSYYPVFNGCTALTTINIGDNVTRIPSYAFEGCTGLTEVNIANLSAWCKIDFGGYSSNPLYYAGKLILNGSEVTNIVIPNDITEIKAYAFWGCSGLISVTIPNSVTSIGMWAFSGCTGLTSVTIPNSVTTIGSQAFWGCDKLIDGSVVATTQTTATIRLTSPTQYNFGAYYSDSDKKQAEGGAVVFTGLSPNTTISKYDLALIINDIYCPIKDFSFTTRSFSASVTGSATTTSVSAIGSYTDGDMTILGEGINYGSSVTNYDGNNTITVSNLDPNRSYTIYYAVKTQEGGVYSASKSFTTSSLTWSNGGFTATSTTSARLSVETNCDATMGTGYEWKRYDAPESLAPSKAPCPVVDGMLIGSLRNLNPDVYYKCRPYYTSSSGNTYYGEWITFFTGDANVYFEPEVRTFSERSVVNNTVTVRGYALPGTDDISEQGFEYWKVPASRATSTVMTVKASGISMTATLADLEYNSTYRYRAYVKTAQGTFYGAEEEFSTGEDPAGIEYIEVDDSNNFDVMLRENPATATAWIKVAGTSAIEAEYYILTTNGGVVANGFIPADGDYQPIELNIAPGLYLMSVTDGSHRKTLRLIVR